MQRCAHLVDLEKCCQTHMFLQNFVLIQPRTSPPKICKKNHYANFATLIPFSQYLIPYRSPRCYRRTRRGSWTLRSTTPLTHPPCRRSVTRSAMIKLSPKRLHPSFVSFRSVAGQSSGGRSGMPQLKVIKFRNSFVLN